MTSGRRKLERCISDAKIKTKKIFQYTKEQLFVSQYARVSVYYNEKKKKKENL